MMEPFQLSLLIGAAIVAFIARRIPRAWLWIITGATSFVVTTAYWRFELPYPAFFAVMVDALVCLILYFFAKQQWEMGLWRIFQTSVLLSLAYLIGLIGPHSAYITGLQVLNWAALALIGGTGILDRMQADGRITVFDRVDHFRSANQALRAKRSRYPFTHSIR